MMSEASYQKKLDYTKEYEKENYRKIMIRIKSKENTELIEYLKSKPSMNDYIVNLIKEDYLKNK